MKWLLVLLVGLVGCIRYEVRPEHFVEITTEYNRPVIFNGSKYRLRVMMGEYDYNVRVYERTLDGWLDRGELE